MAPESPRQRLEMLAAQAQKQAMELAADLERRRGLPAGPGDLFVLPATADLPVEWAVLERGASGKLLVVPADAGLPAGTADVEVPADAPGGPLSLRCRFGVWLEGSLFKPNLRSGVLAPETVDEALHRFRQIEAGDLDGSPLGEEVDADPEYMDWIRDVPQRARELVLAVRPIPIQQPPPQPLPLRSFPSRSWGMAHKLAAALTLVAIGLSLWVGTLLRKVEQLSAPIIATLGEVTLGDEVRGRDVVQVPREASHITLILSIDPSIEPQDGYLEIVNRSEVRVWSSPRMRLDSRNELSLTLTHERLPYGDYRIRVFPEAGFQAEPLTEDILRIEIAE